MAAIYGHRWITNYGDDAAGMGGDTWAAGLAGMTGEQLARGFRACVTSADAWPPSLPEFRAACFGIPTLADVKRDLRPGAPDPSPFARMVQTWIDPFQFRQADARTAFAMVREAYEECARHVLNGGELPQLRLQIADDETRIREHYDALHMERLSQLD